MSDLDRLTQLADLMLQRAGRVAGLEEELKEAKGEHREIEREMLPELMAELGLSEFTLSSGKTIKVEADVTCSITEKNRNLALRWLRDNDFESLIKTEVKVVMPRGEYESAMKLAEELSQNYDGVEAKESVHASTLKSFIKEQMAEGRTPPIDLFSIFAFNKATVK